MRKLSILLGVATGCLLIASSAMATIPSPSNSSCVFEVKTSSPCADADAVWSPDGTLDTLCIRVTVRNALGGALDTCAVRLDLSATADPDPIVGANIGICGSTAGALTLFDTTDANGAAEFKITGGGCGRLELQWTATALCAIPEVELCSDTTQVCVKSPDFTGDLTVNFFDTFKYLPQLSSGSGYCGDLNCSAGVVNFFDTFKYLPALSSGASCTGAIVPIAVLGACP